MQIRAHYNDKCVFSAYRDENWKVKFKQLISVIIKNEYGDKENTITDR